MAEEEDDEGRGVAVMEAERERGEEEHGGIFLMIFLLGEVDWEKNNVFFFIFGGR